MQLKSLTLTNVRAFKQAEFTFQPGLNLIVGINGVGKSTVLDTLRILLSQVLPKLSQSRNKPLDLQDSDITVGQDALTSQLIFEVADTEFEYLAHQPRFLYTEASNSIGEVRNQVYENVYRRDLTPSEENIPKSLKTSSQQPLALYFSPRRALASNLKSTSKTKGLAAAFTDSLDHRELRLMELADWLYAQNILANEDSPNALNHNVAFTIAIARLMDGGYTHLHAHREEFVYQDKNGKLLPKSNTTLLIEKAGIPFDLRQLSDGERGMLALALDLTRRLSQANPNLKDPLQGQAVVLIDELDLHLHPQWQRSIVQKLTTTFPNCQFIATTHSPIIISEVPPENIILIRQEANQTNVIQSGLQGFGLDSSWILRHLMDTESRNPKIQAQIDLIEEALEEGDLDLARQQLKQYRSMIYRQRDDEFIRLEASINNLEALADALDTEE